jgi:hypothetical protein
MNGAIAVPSVITISKPNSTKNTIMGANHHFFRSFKNSQNSNNIDILDILSPKS